MKYLLNSLFLALALSSAVLSASPEPLMVVPGERIVSLEFDKASDVSKKWISFRKETTFKVKNGHFHVIPPVVANEGTGKKSKWGDSDFARAGLVGLPKDYVCRFRWKYNKPTNAKSLAKGLVYIDMGHRVIRTTFSREGTTLLLENHLMGRDKEVSSKVLREAPELRLEPDRWYEIIAEVKGTEVVVQIDGHVLYGNDELIAKDRYGTFNLDATGTGYLLDRIEIRSAGDFRADWKTTRKRLIKDGS